MTRIVAGQAGGRTLRTPTGRGTRPTSEKVRAAIFNALQARGGLRGARVLDLYAGSGALGLEAASRGAATVTLVENDRRAAAVIRANAADLALPGVTVVATSVTSALAAPEHASYDLVLLDPPYHLDQEALGAVLNALLEGGWLEPASDVVVERATRSGEPPWPTGLTLVRAKRYGESTVWFATNG